MTIRLVANQQKLQELHASIHLLPSRPGITQAEFVIEICRLLSQSDLLAGGDVFISTDNGHAKAVFSASTETTCRPKDDPQPKALPAPAKPRARTRKAAAG